MGCFILCFTIVYMGIQGLVLFIAFLLVSKCDHQQSGCYILWIGVFILVKCRYLLLLVPVIIY
jgi:hypothetical protein